MLNKDLLPPNIKDNGTHQRYNTLIENKEVVIGAGKGVDAFQGTRFRDCFIRLRGSAMRTLHSTRNCHFENCLIWAQKKQVGANWEANFYQSVFRGAFELRFSYELMDCDFSQARLSHVFFEAHSDDTSLKGLQYPHIIIMDIRENFDRWNAVDKPADYEDMVWQYKRRERGSLVLNLEDCTTSPDAMWASVWNFSFVKSINSPG